MATESTAQDSEIRELLKRRKDAIEELEKASKGLRTVESRIGRWLVQHLGGIYASWSPQVGDRAVRIVFSGEKPSASLLLVREVYGKTITLAADLNSKWRIRLDLEHFQRHLPDEDDDDEDRQFLEIIVPTDAYDDEVRHWLGLRKSAREL